MDMREMVDKAKRGEPLYGKSQLTEYMQGVASRQSRYSGVFLHVMPWFNFVNHNQVSSHFFFFLCPFLDLTPYLFSSILVTTVAV